MDCKKFWLAAIPLLLSASVVHAAELETLSIKKQTSHYMNMQQQITRIAVGNPDIASVLQLPGSASEFLIVTKTTAGSTSLFVWTIDGSRHEYLIVVSPEDPGQAKLIQEAIGLPNVRVKMVDNRILLTGTVENQYEKNYALQTARLFVNGGTNSSILVGSGFDMKLDVQSSKSTSSDDIETAKSESNGTIIDLLQILHPTQIRLEAQIIEINSDDAKELGIQYGTSGSGGVFYFGENYTRSHTSISESSSNSYSDSYSRSNAYSYGNSSGTRSGSQYNDSSGDSSFGRSVTSTWDDVRTFANNPVKWVAQHFSPINATITALVTKGKAKILSRPSVITLSGEQATIQIGGKVPYTARSDDGWSTQFEDYGIILQFKPVVDAQNRINSAIHTEVSTLSERTVDNQPIIATRRADSVVTLQSGAAIVIGGLMDSSETKTVSKIPLLGDIPILGEFFKHTSKSRDKRELIIVVTPYLVNAEEISRAPVSPRMREFYDDERRQRAAMENYDFKETPDKPLEQEAEEPFQEYY